MNHNYIYGKIVDFIWNNIFYLLINFTFLLSRGCFDRILLFFLIGADLLDTTLYCVPVLVSMLNIDVKEIATS